MTKVDDKVLVEGFETQKYSGYAVHRLQTVVIKERALDVLVDGKKTSTIACTGSHVDELALGFLFSEGLIRNGGDIAGIEVAENGRAVHLTRAVSGETNDDGNAASRMERSPASSGARSFQANPGLGPLKGDVYAGPRVTPATVRSLMHAMIADAALHEKTRGTHCAALADPSGILVVREDIGRHNVVDMLAGYMLINCVDASAKIVIRTGRLSAEIVRKIWNMGIPVVISISVPTSAAVHLAREAGITVIGSVREEQMIVYHDEERVYR